MTNQVSSKIQWSPQQLAAIKTIDSNVLVSAAAGSGKTAVLSKRIIYMLELGVNIDELLIITFTNAAAAEMKGRITNQIRKELKNTKENPNLVEKQLLALNQSYITTFHAFGRSVIDDFNYLLDLNPNYDIGDQTVLDNIKQQIMHEIIYNDTTRNHDLIVNYTEAIEDEKPSSLEEMLLNVYDIARGSKSIDEWLEKSLQLQLNHSVYQEVIASSTNDKINYIEALFNNMEPLVQELNHEKVRDWFNDCLIRLEILKQDNSFDFYSNNLSMEIFNTKPRISPKADELDKALNTKIGGLFTKIKETLEDAIMLYITLDKEKDDETKINDMYYNIINIIKQFDNKYTNYKNSHGLLDFNDLEHYALELLENPIVSEFYKQKFKYIYVDEYQDTNDLQELMISNIANNNVFYVGDIKQSIYGFRNAKPSLFRDKLANYALDERLGQVRPLDRNFRSRKLIIDSVNDIFTKIMTSMVGDVNYDINHSLKTTETFPPITSKAFDRTTRVIITDKADKEYLIVAKEIKDLIENQEFLIGRCTCDGVCDDSCRRKAEYKDVAILLRNMTHANDFCRALASLDIPYYNVKDETFFASDEVNTFINLLKALEDVNNNFLFLHWLNQPKYQIDANTLATLKINYPKDTLYNSIKNENNDTRFALLIEDIKKYQLLKKQLPLDEFLNYLAYDSNYIYDIQRHLFGRQRLANLEQLIIMANDFADLNDFIDYCKKIKEFPAAAIYGKDENVVKIMTIHGSKGLQFPIVFCPQLASRSSSNKQKAISASSDLGIALKYKNIHEHYQYPCTSFNALRCLSLSDSMSEEMRVYYVALTRAEEQLVLSGVQSIKQISAIIDTTTDNLDIFVKAKKCLLTWTLLALNQDLRLRFDEENPTNQTMLQSNLFTVDYIVDVETPTRNYIKIESKEPKMITMDSIFTPIHEPKAEIVNFDNYKKLHQGNIVHYMAHHLDFNKDINEQIKHIVNNHPNQEIAKSINIPYYALKIKKMLMSDLGKDMIEASSKEKLFKEFKIYNVDNESIGIIDCFFIKDNEITLIDYKSDIIEKENINELLNRYKDQIKSYKNTLENLFNMKVVKLGIYSFYLDEFIELVDTLVTV